MRTRTLRRAGLVLAGLVLGLLLIAVGLGVYLRAAQVQQAQETIGTRLRLPEDVLRVEEVSPEGALRIALRRVAILDESGDTIVAAPLARLWLDATSLSGDGPIVLRDVELERPYARLVRAADGAWNIVGALRLEADGREVRTQDEEGSRPILLRDVRIRNGRLLLAMSTEPPDTAGFASRLNLPFARFGGSWHQVYALRDLDARLPLVRVGGESGWRVEVAALDTRLAEPELHITALQGAVAAAGEDGIRLDIETFRFGESRLAAEGMVRLPEGGGGPAYDLRVQVPQLAFSDLARLLPTLPEGGTAQLALEVQTTEGGRTAMRATEMQVVAMESRVAGQLGVVFGGGEPPVFTGTRLSLEPLRLTTLEQLGLVEEVPFLGEVWGTLATEEAVTGVEEGALAIDLAARLVPRTRPAATPSEIIADGRLALGEAGAAVRLQAVRVQLQPLYLSTLAALIPEQQERLRGEVRGVVRLSGTPRELTAEGGELVYRVGSAEPTRLADLSGAVALEPELRYSLRATAQPLALGTLTELFPALPFRTAALSGPIRLDGGAEEARFGVDLAGSAGAIRLAGAAQFSTPLRFEVEGRVETFAASAILRAELPVEGPVSGMFAARGNVEDFRFDVDLAQTAGRFALSGRVRLPEEGPVFEVGGEVENFRLGTLIGQPGLFASPLSGSVQLTGGGAEAYRFDVDLRGDAGGIDLEGFYVPGAVPSYRASGNVAGLDVRRLPFGASLPHTNLTATLDLQGSGTTLETLSGSLQLDARRSLVAGMPLDVAMARVSVQNGILQVDTLAVALRDTRLAASGMWGLTAPAPRPLDFMLTSPDLGILARVIPAEQVLQPRIGGAVNLRGSVGGSVRYPTVVAGLRGRRLQYEQWTVADLTLALDAARAPAVGWGGEATLSADALEMPGAQRLQNLRVRLDGNQSALAVGLVANRDGQTDVTVTGTMDFEGQVPRGVLLDSLTLRVAGASWDLLNPSRIRWGGVDGVQVENLALQRVGEVAGMIRVDGQLPPTGDASLFVQAMGISLDDVRALIGPSAPDMAGRLSLEARLEGPVGGPDLTFDARLDNLRYGELQADLVSVRGDYVAQRLETTSEIWMQGQQVAVAEAAIPMQLSIREMIPSFQLLRQAPLSAEVRADSLPLELFAAMTPQLERTDGVAQAQVRIGGTLDAPELDGWARLLGGAARVVPLGVRYTDVNGLVTLEGNTVRLDSLTARSGGRVMVNGSVRFAPGAGPLVQLAADLNDFRVMDVPDEATVTASGNVALSGDLPRPVLTGRLVIRDATIAIPDLEDRSTVEITDVEVGQVGADSLPSAAFLPPFLADLRVEGLEVVVEESVWLVSDEARIQIAGDLILYRTGEELRVFGLLQAVRGTYALEIGTLVRQFDIASGRVQFFGTGDLNPSLDIVASNRVRTGGTGSGEEITILVNITGTLQSPRIHLTSDTPTQLSETELFSLLIFGRPSFQLGGLGAALAQQLFVQELLGGIVATELGRPILASGLCDYVRVQSGISSLSGILSTQNNELLNTLNAAAIECGKEISDELFVTVETGLGALFAGDVLGGGGGGFDWGIGLEWQIDREWMWELTYGPVRRGPLVRLVNPLTKYQVSTDLRRRWEYGKPSGRPSLQTGPGDPMPGEVRR